jgi:hypothetical protein
VSRCEPRVRTRLERLADAAASSQQRTPEGGRNASVELIAVVPFLLLAILAVGQIALAGHAL